MFLDAAYHSKMAFDFDTFTEHKITEYMTSREGKDHGLKLKLETIENFDFTFSTKSTLTTAEMRNDT